MTTWHADARDLRAWVDGTAGMALGASIEQHLLACADCRMTIAGLVDDHDDLRETVDDGWDRLLTAVQDPPPPPMHRLLARLGVPAADLQAVRSTTTPRLVWLLGLILTLGFVTVAVVLGAEDHNGAVFLAVAPLVPVVGVAVLYGPRTDPTYEIVVAAPYPLIRMVLLRALVVLAVSVPAVLAAGLLLPIPTRVATVWLLPAAGCILAVLAAATWVDIERAAVGAAALWLAAVGIASRRDDIPALLHGVAIDAYVLFIVGAALVLAHRIRHPRCAIRLR